MALRVVETERESEHEREEKKLATSRSLFHHHLPGHWVLDILRREFVGHRYRRSNRLCMDRFVERQCDPIVLVVHLPALTWPYDLYWTLYWKVFR